MIPQQGIKPSMNKPSAFRPFAWFGTNAPKKIVSPSRRRARIQSSTIKTIVINTSLLLSVF